MKRLFLFALLICSSFGYALETTDRNAIEAVIQGYTDAWNHLEGKGFGDGFAEDADFVNIFGMYFSGRNEIEIRHQHIIQTFYKNSTLKILEQRFREVQPGLVIAIVRWRLEGYREPGADNTKPGISREGIFTQVFVNKDSKWEIAASHNTMKP